MNTSQHPVKHPADPFLTKRSTPRTTRKNPQNTRFPHPSTPPHVPKSNHGSAKRGRIIDTKPKTSRTKLNKKSIGPCTACQPLSPGRISDRALGQCPHCVVLAKQLWPNRAKEIGGQGEADEHLRSGNPGAPPSPPHIGLHSCKPCWIGLKEAVTI